MIEAPAPTSDVAQLLRVSAPFDICGDTEIAEICDLLDPVRFAAGQRILVAGDPADRWYLITEGTATVTQVDLIGEPVTLAVLGPGDAFGERALLDSRQPRSASVTALTPLEGFALSADAFRTVARGSPAFVERVSKRLDAMAIDSALKRASPFARIPQQALELLAGQLQPVSCKRGDVIIRQGDPGDSLYLIRSGSVNVFRGKRRVAVLFAGDTFGEMALLSLGVRSATVCANEDTQLLALGRSAFQAVTREQASVAAYFRELIGARFRGGGGQPLLLPDPVTTMMPSLGVRRRKRYWVVLLAGLFLFLLLLPFAWNDPTHTATYLLMAVGAAIGPVVFVQYLAESNILTERPFELLGTAVLGAALGLPPAIWLQHSAGLLPGGLVSALLIALIEEAAKLLGVLWLVRVSALRFRMDGVILGAAAGMGFSAIETALYALARIDTPGVGVVVGVLLFRSLLSPFTHGTWTAIVCATLWRARSVGRHAWRWTVLGAFAIAVVLHGLWDWQAVPVPYNFGWLLLVGSASVLTLRAILHRAADEEARAVFALAPEVATARPSTVGVRCVGCGRMAPAGARYCPRCGLALRRRS